MKTIIDNQIMISKWIDEVLVLLILTAVAIAMLAPGAYGQTNNTSAKNVTNGQDLFPDRHTQSMQSCILSSITGRTKS